ncbi:cell surface glycoprotein MUC18 isoform X2 [Solea senegalensis]|uniref:Cell surface glycoprotein MUC18 isoform X2 n=2 Tax=Solea senegalensis TaxID=28829 RepID=A0AAV6PLT9_SOLSE|nr:melanoma cell adhesion molecule b isoform X3 [Solea senegalensis]KAG7470292.1 cell surface glycoprotein MUC18 isoform X2 [Solea senegalensis]
MAVGNSASLLLGLLVLVHTWGAWAAVDVNMEDRVEVFRGDTAQIACMFTSVDGIGGVTIMWFYMLQKGERQQIYFQDSTMKITKQGTPYSDRISVNGTGANGVVVLTINDVQLRDEVEFICLIKSLTDGTGEGRTKLRVFATPDLPTIEAVETAFSVHDLKPAKIGVCEVTNGYPKPNITWYRENTPLRNDHGVSVVSVITSEYSGLFSVKSEVRMMVTKEDKDAKFYCEVNYFVPGGTRMTETNRINITVYYPSTAVKVWVESPKGKIKEGDSIELQCHGDGNSPSSVLTITHDGGLEETLDDNRLVLSNVTRLNSGVYHCNSLDLESDKEITGNTTVFVNYLDPAVVIPHDTVVIQGEELVATCNALSSPLTHTVVWFKDGREISRGHTLKLKDTTFSTAGTYVCVVTVAEIEGMETSGTLRVTVKGQPKIIRPDNTDIEESFEKSVNLNCMVRGFPVPSITWTTSDGQVLKTVSQEETEDSVKSVVSVKVMSDITAVCNASNEYGTETLTFSIKATILTTTQASTTASTISSNTAEVPKKLKKEGSGVIIAVIIICILLLAILGSVLYFLYKKGKICGRSGKQDLSKEKSSKDNIVVEMKSDNTEEAILLGVNGEKQPPSDQ